MLNLKIISQANKFLEKKIRRTPIEFSPMLSKIVDSPVYLKLEQMQITGSFKVRGALFYLSTLSNKEKKQGVAACSAGNHGLGVAYAAMLHKIKSSIYVPKSIDPSKKEKIKNYGAEIIESEFDGYDDTFFWSKEKIIKKGQHFISAFEDDRIMAANGGTLATEILEDIPDIENIFFPVGGGGLGAGICYYLKKMSPSTKLYGCQHVDSPALRLSLEKKTAVTVLPAISTIAGGIEGGIGETCFNIIKPYIENACLVSEDEIKKAVLWIIENHQYLVEPTAAVTIAACLSDQRPKLRGKTVILLSGRNVALSTLKNLNCV